MNEQVKKMVETEVAKERERILGILREFFEPLTAPEEQAWIEAPYRDISKRIKEG